MFEPNQPLHTLRDLLDYDMRKFISAEIQLQNSLPKWINTARSVKLKSVLFRYSDVVQQHIKKIEPFIEQEQISSLSVNNQMIQSFIKEMEEKLAWCTDPEVTDACLTASIQAINHYKISMYGTAAAFAKTLGHEEQAAVFHEVEVNEKQIDDRLSQLADFEINKNAKGPFVLID